MLTPLFPGIQLSKRLLVDESRCIKFMGPEAAVYATPSMVNDAEHACHEVLLPHFSPGESSVGMEVQIQHLAATPIGMHVTVQARVVHVEGRKVTFEFEIRDDLELVGQGTHARMVVDIERTIERLHKKRAQWAENQGKL